MLRINRSLSIENDNLSECVHILEKDLEFAITDFEELIQQVRNGGRITEVKKKLGQTDAQITEEQRRKQEANIRKLQKLERSLLDTSKQVSRVRSQHSLNHMSMSNALAGRERSREQSKTKGQTNVEKVKKMQKELDSRKKLNKMLLKEIQKLKAKESTQGNDSGKKDKRRREKPVDKTFNLFHHHKAEDRRLNRSLLGGNTEKNEYLKGLESDLIGIEPIKKEATKTSQGFTKNLEPTADNLQGEISPSQIIIQQETVTQKNQKEAIELEEEIISLKKRLDIHESIHQKTKALIIRLQNNETFYDVYTEYDQDMLANVTQQDLSELTVSQLQLYLEQINDQVKYAEAKNKPNNGVEVSKFETFKPQKPPVKLTEEEKELLRVQKANIESEIKAQNDQLEQLNQTKQFVEEQKIQLLTQNQKKREQFAKESELVSKEWKDRIAAIRLQIESLKQDNEDLGEVQKIDAKLGKQKNPTNDDNEENNEQKEKSEELDESHKDEDEEPSPNLETTENDDAEKYEHSEDVKIQEDTNEQDAQDAEEELEKEENTTPESPEKEEAQATSPEQESKIEEVENSPEKEEVQATSPVQESKQVEEVENSLGEEEHIEPIQNDNDLVTFGGAKEESNEIETEPIIKGDEEPGEGEAENKIEGESED